MQASGSERSFQKQDNIFDAIKYAEDGRFNLMAGK